MFFDIHLAHDIYYWIEVKEKLNNLPSTGFLDGSNLYQGILFIDIEISAAIVTRCVCTFGGPVPTRERVYTKRFILQ